MPWTDKSLLLANPFPLHIFGLCRAADKLRPAQRPDGRPRLGAEPAIGALASCGSRSSMKQNRSLRRAASEGGEGASTLPPGLQACRYDLTQFTIPFQVGNQQFFTSAACLSRSCNGRCTRVCTSVLACVDVFVHAGGQRSDDDDWRGSSDKRQAAQRLHVCAC